MPDATTTADAIALPAGRTPVHDEPIVTSIGSTVAPPLASLWRQALLAFSIGFACLLAIFNETVQDLFDGWGRTGTYAHGYIIFPVSVWLIWRLRHRLATVAPKAQPLALVPLAACGAAWLVAHSVGVHAPRQYAFVAMVPCLVWAVFGNDVTRRILYPLAFLFFAVPAGDFLMPTLMDHTANFTVVALRASGVPVYREGNYFQIPSGNWSVVEACSGLRYLIASITLGFLFAYLNYRAAWRRAAFIVASLLVPVVANWLRAYMIVMIANLSSNKLATGVDHIIYGWLFFGLVMMLLFWVGNFWRDDDAAFDEPVSSTSGGFASSPARGGRTIVIVTAVFVLVAAPWPALGKLLEARADGPHPGSIAVDRIDGWKGDADAFTTFKPHYLHSRSMFAGTFAAGDRRVGLFVAYYSGQLDNGLMVTYDNDVVLVGDKVWGSVGERMRDVPLGGGDVLVVENDVRGDGGNERLKTWRWYWVNGRLTSSKVLAKVYNASDKLIGRGDDSAVVVLTAPVASGQNGDAAEESLRAFAIAAEPRIRAALAAVHDQARR